MALTLERLPRFLVLEPSSTVRFEVLLGQACPEVDVELGNPAPGRSYLLMVGPHGGPMVQRMRLTGRATVRFPPGERRPQVLMVANPAPEPLVLRLEGHAARAGRRPPAARPDRPRWPPRGNPPSPSKGLSVGVVRSRGPVTPDPLRAGLRRGRPKD